MDEMLIGIDISYYDPILDWKNYSWDFAFIKAIEGTVPDVDFPVQWAASQGYTIRGAYDFFHHFNDQREAVDKLLKLLGNDRGELPPVLDLEDDDGEPDKVAPKALEWLRECKRRIGRKPIVYISLGFANIIKMQNYPEFTEYPLWLAQYPWDKISNTWTEEMRRNQIYKMINERNLYIIPNAVLPYKGKPAFVQWTGKCPPEFVPGYPIHDKKAVDVNFFPGTMKQLFDKFNISYVPKPKGDDVDKTPTMTADLKNLQPSNLRTGPGLGFKINTTLIGPITITGTGEKILRDGYYWIEVIAIGDSLVTGWVALTTAYTNIQWITPSPSPTGKEIVKVVTYFKDGTIFETFPK
ncbi:MAG: GH25 family lysozyme [Casimicrobiaceae bacterium]